MISVEDRKEQIIESIALNGFQRKFMNLLFQDSTEVAAFVAKYTQKIQCGKVMLALLNYRQELVRKIPMTLCQFVNLYGLNKKRTLEQLFVMPIDDSIVQTLDHMIYDQEITLESLYMRHVDEPTCNILLLMK